MNQTQGLGTVSFFTAHNKLLGKEDRKRVANQLTRVLQDFLKVNRFDSFKILDVGCSNGIVTKFLSTHGGKIIGVDVDKSAISEALRYKSSNLSFKVASGNNLPFHNGQFDIVICNQVYSYTSGPTKMVSEIQRVLKDGGVCLFTGDNLLRPVEPLYNFPFLRWLPRGFSKRILQRIGYKNIYIGRYKTYWGLRKLCANFTITDYTLKILKQPEKFQFVKLLKYKKIAKIIPDFGLKLIEPFLPTFIFILEKS